MLTEHNLSKHLSCDEKNDVESVLKLLKDTNDPVLAEANHSNRFRMIEKVLSITDPETSHPLSESLLKKMNTFRYDPSLASLILATEVCDYYGYHIDNSDVHILMKQLFQSNDNKVNQLSHCLLYSEFFPNTIHEFIQDVLQHK